MEDCIKTWSLFGELIQLVSEVGPLWWNIEIIGFSDDA